MPHTLEGTCQSDEARFNHPAGWVASLTRAEPLPFHRNPICTGVRGYKQHPRSTAKYRRSLESDPGNANPREVLKLLGRASNPR